VDKGRHDPLPFELQGTTYDLVVKKWVSFYANVTMTANNQNLKKSAIKVNYEQDKYLSKWSELSLKTWNSIQLQKGFAIQCIQLSRWPSKSLRSSLFLQRLPRPASDSLLHCWQPNVFGCGTPCLELSATTGYVSAISGNFLCLTQMFLFTESYPGIRLIWDISVSTHCL